MQSCAGSAPHLQCTTWDVTSRSRLGRGSARSTTLRSASSSSLLVPAVRLSTRPQAEFFYIYGWLIKIYGCFPAKPYFFRLFYGYSKKFG